MEQKLCVIVSISNFQSSMIALKYKSSTIRKLPYLCEQAFFRGELVIFHGE